MNEDDIFNYFRKNSAFEISILKYNDLIKFELIDMGNDLDFEDADNKLEIIKPASEIIYRGFSQKISIIGVIKYFDNTESEYKIDDIFYPWDSFEVKIPFRSRIKISSRLKTNTIKYYLGNVNSVDNLNKMLTLCENNEGQNFLSIFTPMIFVSNQRDRDQTVEEIKKIFAKEKITKEQFSFFSNIYYPNLFGTFFIKAKILS